MIKILTFSILSLIFPMLAHAGSTAEIAGIEIKDAWIAEAPPVSTVNAAYMKIVNTTHTDIRIVSIACENYSSAEFHRTVNIDGVASMRHHLCSRYGEIQRCCNFHRLSTRCGYRCVLC